MRGSCIAVSAAVATLLLSDAAVAQAPAPRVRVVRAAVGTMQTNLGHGIILNERSSLPREAITVHHPQLPVRISDTVSVSTIYADRTYQYSAVFSLTPTEPIVAYEVRIILFDVFGDRTKVLSSTKIADLAAETVETEKSHWNIFSENEAAEFYASIAYVACVRTKAGKVIEADIAPVVAEARRFSQEFSPADLKPKPSTP